MNKQEKIEKALKKVVDAFNKTVKTPIKMGCGCHFREEFVYFLVDFLINNKKVGRINSKKKGSHGELELANLLKEFGFKTRRTQQFCGKSEDSADVIGLPQIHIECKRVENLNLDDALKQAQEDVACKPIPNEKDRDIAAVFHRKNKTGWKVTVSLEDFLRLYQGEVQYEEG